MTSAWLRVPLDQYEGHMTARGVEQLDALSTLFARALRDSQPASVAVLGVAGGNGLDHIDSGVTTRVVGVDINEQYLDATRKRYSALPGLELHCLDLSESTATLEPVQLVHAALIFEHAGVGRCLDNALATVADGGRFSVVLQLAGKPGHEISPTGFPAMQHLKPEFNLIDPAQFRSTVEARNWTLEEQLQLPLPAEKALWMGIFQRNL
jgi:hypothetical protein